MIYISLAHFYIPKILCFLSIVINTLFINLAYRKSSQSIRKYKYLLITFSCVNLCTTLLELVVPISTESFQFSFIVFVSESIIYKYRDVCQFLLVLRCSMVAYTFGLISVHFLYRYFAICQNHWIVHFFKPRFIFLTVISVLIYGSSWLFLMAQYTWPGEMIRQELDNDFVRTYKETTENVPFIVASYNADSEKNGMLAVILAAIILFISLIFDAVLANRIHNSIKILSLSDYVKRVHRNLLITLIIQTTIPSILTFFPCLVLWFYPFFNLNWSYYGNSIFIPIVNCYPIIDPIVISLALNDYRIIVLAIFAVLLVIFVIFAIYFATSYTYLDKKLICKNADVRVARECLHKIGRLENLSKSLPYGYSNPEKFEELSILCKQTDKCLSMSSCLNVIPNFEYVEILCEISHYSSGSLKTCFSNLNNFFTAKNESSQCLDLLFNQNHKIKMQDCSKYFENQNCVHQNVAEICGDEKIANFKSFEELWLSRLDC
ncbi:unnamed protein product [Caenorhabditis angaria]|uniref:T20D4.11-like domain-containing protein n=1 Tax=Caenorhabditis angaria TaxID=860376 RepID=A0A9P1ITZ5_9PELO|nr:unnamed protein product [Caenorhabditis angaria]